MKAFLYGLTIGAVSFFAFAGMDVWGGKAITWDANALLSGVMAGIFWALGSLERR